MIVARTIELTKQMNQLNKEEIVTLVTFVKFCGQNYISVDEENALCQKLMNMLTLADNVDKGKSSCDCVDDEVACDCCKYGYVGYFDEDEVDEDDEPPPSVKSEPKTKTKTKSKTKTKTKK